MRDDCNLPLSGTSIEVEVTPRTGGYSPSWRMPSWLAVWSSVYSWRFSKYCSKVTRGCGRRRCGIRNVDDSLRRLAEDMYETMLAAPGVAWRRHRSVYCAD